MDIFSKVIPLHLHPLGFIEAFLHYGADLGEVLDNTQINENMLGSKDVKISREQQHTLILNGIRSCNKPGLGILVGQFMEWSYNGPVGGIVHCSPSFRAAGDAFLRYVMIAQPHYAMYLTRPRYFIDENGMVIAPNQYFATEAYDPQLYMFEREYRLTVSLRLLDMCGNKAVDNTDVIVGLNYPKPAHAALYDELPCTSIEFGKDYSYVGAHHLYVTTPWRQFRKHAFDRIIEQCEEEFLRTNIEQSYTAKVRWHISTLFTNQVTLEIVAEALGLSPRALTRKLAAENTSFRNILHDIRMEFVTFNLQSSRLSVEEIAEITGFSGASSLRRAIKNWSGNAAGELRNCNKPTVIPIDFNDRLKAG